MECRKGDFGGSTRTNGEFGFQSPKTTEEDRTLWRLRCNVFGPVAGHSSLKRQAVVGSQFQHAKISKSLSMSSVPLSRASKTKLIQTVILMRCAKGFLAKGIWGCTGFPLLRWEKGSETPPCGGEKGLRLPRSSCSDLGNEGVSDPFPHRKRESQTLFPTAKEETPYIPKSP